MLSSNTFSTTLPQTRGSCKTSSISQGFTLIELLVVIAIIALLIGIIIPALGGARMAGRLAVALSNEKQIITAASSFAATNNGALYTFTWKQGQRAPTGIAGQGLSRAGKTTRNAASDRSDVDAAARQAIYLIRRMTRRTAQEQPARSSWIPHVLYSHLMIMDYISGKLPEEAVVDPGDFVLQSWAQTLDVDTAKYPLIRGPEDPPGFFDVPSKRTYPFSSSYHLTVGHYDRMQQVPAVRGRAKDVRNRRISPFTASGFIVPQTDQTKDSRGLELGGNRFDNVSFPSQKVMLFDRFSRHSGKNQLFFAIDDARIPIAFYDGSVSVQRTVESNNGWFPRLPRPDIYYFFNPDPYYDGTRNRDGIKERVRRIYDSTASGLKGIDFGAKRIMIDTDFLN